MACLGPNALALRNAASANDRFCNNMRRNLSAGLQSLGTTGSIPSAVIGLRSTVAIRSARLIVGADRPR